MEPISKHKVGRYGEQLVFNVLEGAKWANGGFEAGSQYDIDWNGILIDVNASSILKRTSFVFSNASGYDPKLVNVFVGIDGENIYCWVKKGLEKTGFYGRVSEAIKLDQLADEIGKLANG